MFGRRRKPQTPTPLGHRPAYTLPSDTTARFLSVRAAWMDESWIGHEVMTGAHIGEVLAVEQHPTHHRTVLVLATRSGVECVDVHDEATVTTDPQGVMQ